MVVLRSPHLACLLVTEAGFLSGREAYERVERKSLGAMRAQNLSNSLCKV